MWSYYIPGNSETEDDAVVLDSLLSFEQNPNGAAEAAGRHYFHKRNGWEDSWPITFVVLKDGVFQGPFTVDMEMEPVFHVKRKD